MTNAFFLWHWARKMFGFYITLTINKIPCLRRRLGYINKVKDGLDEDLFVRRRNIGGFGLRNEAKDFTPMIGFRDEALSTMQDLYLLKLPERGKEGVEETYEPELRTSFVDDAVYTENPGSVRSAHSDTVVLLERK